MSELVKRLKFRIGDQVIIQYSPTGARHMNWQKHFVGKRGKIMGIGATGSPYPYKVDICSYWLPADEVCSELESPHMEKPWKPEVVQQHTDGAFPHARAATTPAAYQAPAVPKQPAFEKYKELFMIQENAA